MANIPAEFVILFNALNLTTAEDQDKFLQFVKRFPLPAIATAKYVDVNVFVVHGVAAIFGAAHPLKDNKLLFPLCRKMAQFDNTQWNRQIQRKYIKAVDKLNEEIETAGEFPEHSDYWYSKMEILSNPNVPQWLKYDDESDGSEDSEEDEDMCYQ